MTTPQPTAPIRSEFADDPDMAELVELFVSELEERTETIASAMDGSDWETLTRMAHQLKGASGGYGFPSIGAKAAEVEHRLRAGETDDLDSLKNQVDELIQMCNRAAV